MSFCDFVFHRPTALTDACRLGQRLGAGALYFAGGTELLPDIQRGVETASDLIALDGVPELHGIAFDGAGLRIGAMTTIRELAESPAVREAYPVLAEAALTLGGPQIRSQATLGGNFCRAVPCADTPPACIVGGATVRLVSEEGERTLPAENFFVGPRCTVLRPGELLVEILIPPQPPRSGASYQRFALRQGSALAVASVAARLVLNGDKIGSARVALGSVAPVPLAATRSAAMLEGRAPEEDLFARVAAEAAAEARPISDLRGSEPFRRLLVEVLARRALREAAARASERAA